MNSLLNAEQLVEQSKRIEEFEILARGNKISQHGEETEEPAHEPEEYLENLKEMLHLERVIFSNKISKGVYEQDKNRVRMETFTGKWKAGYFEDSVNYLKPHEALHLIEMVKLEVTFDSVAMSVEQAYSIFLDPENGLSFEEYLVYSYLTRAGYFVFQYESTLNVNSVKASSQKQELNSEDEMIWLVLMEQLNQPFSSDLIRKNPELYERTKASMLFSTEKISGKRISVEHRCSQTEREPPIKKQKPNEVEPQDNNFLDILKSETEYFAYEDIFKKFSFIRRAENFKSSGNDLEISFEIYNPRLNFKKCESSPNYLLLVIKSSDEFPTNAQLAFLSQQQSLQLPILLAIMSESLSIHFSICSF